MLSRMGPKLQGDKTLSILEIYKIYFTLNVLHQNLRALEYCQINPTDILYLEEEFQGFIDAFDGSIRKIGNEPSVLTSKVEKDCEESAMVCQQIRIICN